MRIKKLFSLPVFYITLMLVAGFPGLVQAQTNTPNPVITVLPQADTGVAQWKQADFLAFDPHYKEERAACVARTMKLFKEVIARETAGQYTGLSHQILIEVIWLISATADFRMLDQRLDDLQANLDHPERELNAEAEDSIDGSWGKGDLQWFTKLRASYAHLEEAKYPLHFIDRINSPERLTTYLDSLSVSDISHTGIDHEEEFNEATSDLLRMILRNKPAAYAYDPRLKATIIDLILHHLRNPVTGYWGEKYIHNGQVQFVDDLSITFHMVSYLDGNIPDMDKVVGTTLAVLNLESPVGPLYKNQHYDHLNMDVAELFRLGWPHASEAQKKAIVVELHKLLQGCLTESLQPDGSFKMWVGDFSKEESTYYGASFLARVGYFDKSKRFWTEEDFPDAERVRQRIIGYILSHLKSGATGGEYYNSALDQLGYKLKHKE